MDERIKFVVGLDVHKDSISIAACDMSREPARFAGTVNSAEGVRGLRATDSSSVWSGRASATRLA